MIVLVTGYRWARLEYVLRVLDAVHADTPISEIRNGGMVGADAASSYWAYLHKVNTSCFGAKWGDRGGSAGPERNKDMIFAQPTPDLVVAFLAEDSRGTKSCIRKAEEKGIPVRVFNV